MIQIRIRDRCSDSDAAACRIRDKQMKGTIKMSTRPTENPHPEMKTKMKTPPIVSQQEWEAARQQLLVKEKAFTHSRDALAAERRRMPWLAVGPKYEFRRPEGEAGRL